MHCAGSQAVNKSVKKDIARGNTGPAYSAVNSFDEHQPEGPVGFRTGASDGFSGFDSHEQDSGLKDGWPESNTQGGVYKAATELPRPRSSKSLSLKTKTQEKEGTNGNGDWGGWPDEVHDKDGDDVDDDNWGKW